MEIHPKSGVVVVKPSKESKLGTWLFCALLFGIVPPGSLFIYHTTFPPMMRIALWALLLSVFILGLLVFIFGNRRNVIQVDFTVPEVTYRTALGTSTVFRTGPGQLKLDAVYFPNSSRLMMFNKQGWVCFYSGTHQLFRLNMDRWNIRDVKWLSDAISARLKITPKFTRISEIESDYPGYFPMYVSKPVLSWALIGIASLLAVLGEIALWYYALSI